jgi:hypothetical protein
MSSPQRFSPSLLNPAIKPQSPQSPRLQKAFSNSSWENGGKINRLVSSKNPLSPSQATGTRLSPTSKTKRNVSLNREFQHYEDPWKNPVIREFRPPLTPAQTPKLTANGIIFEDSLLSNEERAGRVNLLDNYTAQDDGLQFLKDFAFAVRTGEKNNIEEIRALLAKSKHHLVWLDLPQKIENQYFDNYLHIYRNNQMVLIELSKKLSFPLDNLKSSFLLLERWFLQIIEKPPDKILVCEYNEWKTRIDFFLEEGISGFCDLEVQQLVRDALSPAEKHAIAAEYQFFL